MSSDSPNAAPPCVTTPTHWSSVAALLTGQEARSAGGTSVRTDAFGVPRASAPWQRAHQAPKRLSPVPWPLRLHAHSAAQTTSLSVRSTTNLLDLCGLQGPILHHHPPVHQHVAHVGGAGAVHNPRDQIRLRGLRVRTVQVEYDQIGPLADFDRPDFAREPERPRAAECGQFE